MGQEDVCSARSALLALSVERGTPGLRVMSSSPMPDIDGIYEAHTYVDGVRACVCVEEKKVFATPHRERLSLLTTLILENTPSLDRSVVKTGQKFLRSLQDLKRLQLRTTRVLEWHLLGAS